MADDANPKVIGSAPQLGDHERESNPRDIPTLAIGTSVQNAASAVGVSRSTLYAAIAAGALPAKKVGGRTIILIDDLREWVRGLPDFRGRR